VRECGSEGVCVRESVHERVRELESERARE